MATPTSDHEDGQDSWLSSRGAEDDEVRTERSASHASASVPPSPSSPPARGNFGAGLLAVLTLTGAAAGSAAACPTTLHDSEGGDSREEWEAAEWEEAREEWEAEGLRSPPLWARSPDPRHEAVEELQMEPAAAEEPPAGAGAAAWPLSSGPRRRRRAARELQAEVAGPRAERGPLRERGGTCSMDRSSSANSGLFFDACDSCPASSTTSAANQVPHTDLSSCPDGQNVEHTPLGQSPGHGVASIHEPLVILDDEPHHHSMERLKAELAEARAAAKSDRLALEEAAASTEELKRECDELRSEGQRTEQENRVLRLQLEDHHGIMAADWEQTLGFQERLRQEEMDKERLAAEVAELRESLRSRAAEFSASQEDAAQWRLLTSPSAVLAATASELDGLLEASIPAMARLQAETHRRTRIATKMLHSELENQLCVVCRDAKKTVLFLPCSHICVCETCRGRLRPYRCPMCQEPVQNFVARVHF
mmetsp:Transcript_16803/g.54251  ORF Transcript_16803/g.54251 Transcript_16803/m.54251 type:complete len:480 (-) Transcript_16803:299-1738(-)